LFALTLVGTFDVALASTINHGRTTHGVRMDRRLVYRRLRASLIGESTSSGASAPAIIVILLGE
jgi:hypothetical protein